MIYAAVLAAGLGVRMHRQDLPKPFLALGNKPIIIHTLEQFYVNKQIGHIIVVTADTWRTYAEPGRSFGIGRCIVSHHR